LLTGRHRGGRC